MEIKDIITIISIAALIIGWFINSWLNRRNEIAKERLKYRMETLQSIIQILSELQESSATLNGDISHLQRLIRDTLTKFYIYGEADEIYLCNELREAYNKKDSIEFSKAIEKLSQLVSSKIRVELKLPILTK